MSEIVVHDQASRALVQQMGVTDEQVDVVRRTVAKGSTDEELAMFFSLAQKYELDPFAKEVFLICPLTENGERKVKNGRPEAATIIVSRDGFLAIANRHPAFEGMTSEVVRAEDTFERHPDGSIEHAYDMKRGAVVAAYAIVYRNDRRVPSYFYARWEEYGKPNATKRDGSVNYYSPWSKYPSAMLKKVAEAMCLKQAFSVSGVVTEEELDAGRAIDEGADTELQPRASMKVPQIARGVGQARIAGEVRSGVQGVGHGDHAGAEPHASASSAPDSTPAAEHTLEIDESGQVTLTPEQQAADDAITFRDPDDVGNPE